MRSPIETALLNPLNLVMLALSALAGLVAAWWLFPLGLLFWGLMVAAIANDKSIRINYNMEARLGTLSSRFREPYARAVRAQTRIFNSLLGASGSNRGALEPVQAEIEKLVDEIYQVCYQMTAPENYLAVARGKTADLEGERALLVLSIDKSMTPEVRREKEEAVRDLENKIQKTKTIATMLSRVEAQVNGSSGMMESMLADMMRLQVLGTGQIRQEVPGLLQQIRAEMQQLKSVETEIAQLR
jgi:hypothetical protein